MSTEGRTAESMAAPLESASFVRFVTRADGDALAASGLLARAMSDRGVPFQVTVGRTVAERTARAMAGEAENGDVTIVVGSADADVTQLGTADRAATLEAVSLVRDLGETPDPILALSGLMAAGSEPGAGESEWLLETARERGLVDRRPGVAVPTADPVDGLAHSTRLRAPWSGDPDAVREALEALSLPESDALDADDHRAIGSLVALEAVGCPEATDESATAIQRALKPYATPDAPFATVGGYADVLAATARTEPGTGTALAMGHGVSEAALAAWRAHGRRTHAALETATTGRYDGLFVLGVEDGPVETIAEVAVAYRSPESTVLVVSEGESSSDEPQAGDATGEAAIATRGDESLGATVEAVARDLESETDGDVEYDDGRRCGYLRYDPDVDESTIIATVREFQ
ncbi:exonuclease [Natronococcus pandeyae]|uniref:Exonuclease n=1 Tax=Natronococcus pandeyae TaxID=2055836 RepID=A0A8J8Q9H9_9EURY|nr:exonuclease [Natronococcus pandeyae]TYL40469.1 exonuclease [Natronococcus pandeyae]